MSKKTHQKKKVQIKLENNQSYLIEDLEILLHIQKTYGSMLRGNITEKEKDIYTRIFSAINLSIENAFIAPVDSENDEW
jgi:hypothetical protein